MPEMHDVATQTMQPIDDLARPAPRCRGSHGDDRDHDCRPRPTLMRLFSPRSHPTRARLIGSPCDPGRDHADAFSGGKSADVNQCRWTDASGTCNSPMLRAKRDVSCPWTDRGVATVPVRWRPAAVHHLLDAVNVRREARQRSRACSGFVAELIAQHLNRSTFSEIVVWPGLPSAFVRVTEQQDECLRSTRSHQCERLSVVRPSTGVRSSFPVARVEDHAFGARVDRDPRNAWRDGVRGPERTRRSNGTDLHAGVTVGVHGDGTTCD